MKKESKKKLLDTQVCDLPGLSTRVRNKLPWSYGTEIRIGAFFEWCAVDSNAKKVRGWKIPHMPGIGIHGFQQIRTALLKVGFTAKDSDFLRGPLAE